MTDPEAALNLAHVFIVILTGLGVLAAFIARPCTCEKCAFHTNERRMEREAKRASDHRKRHRYFDIPWGDDMCGQCRAGHEGDRQT